MKQRWILAIGLSILFLWSAAPVAAGPGSQGDGVHFGPYTLKAGDSASGDLTVVGAATLEADAQFDGDLTVMGAATIHEGAAVDGNLVVLGAAEIAGEIDGDVFAAGEVTLLDTAWIGGDLSAVSTIYQEEGAVVEGELLPMEEEDFQWDFPTAPPLPEVTPNIQIERRSSWLQGVWDMIRAVVNIFIMGLLALVIASLWPRPIDRVRRVIEEKPLLAFGAGLVALVLTPIAFVLLAITLCLLPLGIVGLIVVSVGVLLGLIALGSIVGHRVLAGINHPAQYNPVIATVVGTILLFLVLTLTQLFGPIHALLIFVIIPLAAGATLLTRFGTMPYATQGRPSAPTAPRSGPRPAPMPTPPPMPASDEVTPPPDFTSPPTEGENRPQFE